MWVQTTSKYLKELRDGFSLWFVHQWSDHMIHADGNTLGWNVSDNY